VSAASVPAKAGISIRKVGFYFSDADHRHLNDAGVLPLRFHAHEEQEANGH